MKFSIPKKIKSLSDKANLALAFGFLTSRLATEERTRTVHPGGRNENVAEHSLMLVKVAVALAERYYPELDSGKVAIYASLHDDIEAYVGDTPTDHIAQYDAGSKKQLERLGKEQLVKEFLTIAPSYTKHVKSYELQKEPEARFVRVVDKIMVEIIHFPNKGAVLKEYYTLDVARQADDSAIRRLKREYPDFIELVDVKHELARYLRDEYLG